QEFRYASITCDVDPNGLAAVRTGLCLVPIDQIVEDRRAVPAEASPFERTGAAPGILRTDAWSRKGPHSTGRELMTKAANARTVASRAVAVTPAADAVDALRYPDIADLMSRLHFSPAEGRIWLDDLRMVLVHTSAMGVLRRELIESLGIDRARGLLTRMGYNSGARDAELARKVRPGG